MPLGFYSSANNNYNLYFLVTIGEQKQPMELCPNSSLAGYQAVLTLDVLGFSYCHMEYQDLIQMQLKIQSKL